MPFRARKAARGAGESSLPSSRGGRLRVAFVVPRFHTNLFYATKALKQADISVHLMCTSVSGLEDHSEVQPMVLDQDKATWPQVYRLIAQIKPDLLVIRSVGRLSRLVHGVGLVQRRAMIGYDQRPYLSPRPLGRVLLGVARGRPIRRITPVHGRPEEGGRPDPFAFYLPFPVGTMPSGEARAYAPGGAVRILCVGKLAQPRKNHLLLLKALEPLASEFDFRVTLAGNATLDMETADRGYLEEVLAYRHTGAIRHRLAIKRDVEFQRMQELYSEHDICVLPSRQEPLGTAPLEAMGMGCAAIVSSDTGSAYYVSAAGKAGYPCGAVFPTGNRDALTDALRPLLADPGRLTTYGRAAAEWTRQELSLELFVQRFLTCF